jgi:2-methylcitrate dehydratase PrpD
MAVLCAQHQIDPAEVKVVNVSVYQAAKDVLGAVFTPASIHQSKFSMGFVLALIACKGVAGVSEFTEAALHDPELLSFHDKVTMQVDAEIEAVYPQKWCARVDIEMNNGAHYSHLVDTPKGDPGNTLSRAELEQKAHKLVAFFNVCTAEEMNRLIDLVWSLPSVQSIDSQFVQQ